ncbi:MAG: MFS transporter [Chloroflexi bacterium]|nr:MFS transporter [Chloroflexota bacterium]
MRLQSVRSRVFVLSRTAERGYFRELWWATAAANLADGVFKLALPLWATHFTNSPALVAGVAFAVRLPWLLFALLAGVLADRFDRRVMMVGANLFRFVTLLLVVIIGAVGGMSLSILFLVAFILGVAETLADTAGSSILPAIVGTGGLERANARLVGVTTVTNEFIGPPLGGALIAASVALAFATSSTLYLFAAIAIFLIRGTYKVQPLPTGKPRILNEIAAGLRYVWNDRLLRALVIIVGVMNLGWSAWLSIMVLYVVEPGPGGLSEFGYGLMLTSIGMGGLAGSVVAVPFVSRFGRRWAIAADILGTFTMLAVPAIIASAWAIGAAAIIGGIGGAMWSIVVSSIRQQVVPDSMLGKTGGVFRLFGYGALPLGSAFAGIIAEGFGIPAVFALCAALTLLLLIPFYRDISPVLSRR